MKAIFKTDTKPPLVQKATALVNANRLPLVGIAGDCWPKDANRNDVQTPPHITYLCMANPLQVRNTRLRKTPLRFISYEIFNLYPKSRVASFQAQEVVL
ncbi:MAG: hypothetical protein K9K38_09060 [Rhodoferax sp.]|nr:hypothetical protein [Rhodoferax sp.]MCF8209536.1 hypothetical protein [Rhodoferax sp.]